MSYELKIDPKSRAAGRFIGHVRKALVSAAIDEKKETGVNQNQIATRLGVNRSVINRLLRGEANLTLRSVAEIAWALGWEPVFSLRRRVPDGAKRNHFEPAAADRLVVKPATGTTATNPMLRSSTATSRVNTLELTD